VVVAGALGGYRKHAGHGLKDNRATGQSRILRKPVAGERQRPRPSGRTGGQRPRPSLTE
jgi:hypothetical protein